MRVNILFLYPSDRFWDPHLYKPFFYKYEHGETSMEIVFNSY